MKTIATLLIILGIPCAVLSQTKCSIIYSNEIEAYFYEDSTDVKCNEIMIQNLPPLSQSYAYMKLYFSAKGSYLFKKAAGLIIPDGYNIYIEDQLTGQVFDLKLQESYTFNVNRVTPERFIFYQKPLGKLVSKNSTQ